MWSGRLEVRFHLPGLVTEIRFLERLPEVGELVELKGQLWSVAHVQRDRVVARHEHATADRDHVPPSVCCHAATVAAIGSRRKRATVPLTGWPRGQKGVVSRLRHFLVTGL